MLEVGPCLSPTGFILVAVARSNANRVFVPAALDVLDSGTDVSALPLARGILAAANHPRAEPEACSLLSSGTFDCVAASAGNVSCPTANLVRIAPRHRVRPSRRWAE
jgi:hypothetical protein